jgi:hypothetical protein
MKKMVILVLTTLFVMNGCTQLSPKKQESAFIVIKTPKMKYADMGFIAHDSLNVKVEIYAAGQPLVAWEINAFNICMSTFKCMEKKDFNQEFLMASYPDTLLENIFRGEVIFKKRGYKKIKNGFEQSINDKNHYAIRYKVVDGERIFRDKLNKILIKVREQK